MTIPSVILIIIYTVHTRLVICHVEYHEVVNPVSHMVLFI